MDAVQKVGNGHPGTAMSLAPAAYLLFQKVMRHDPADPHWPGRDRFVLSCGHSSLTLYIQLYLAGYGLELDDLKALRTWGSQTPGHPEHGHTAGVETTTGPLGQGVGNAVGMAMAARRERGLLDPDAAAGREPVRPPRSTRSASDGDIEEGVSGEASSLAGHQQLGNLVAASTTTTRSRSRTTPTIALSPRTSPRATRPTAGTCRTSTGPTTARTYDEDVAGAVRRRSRRPRPETDRPSFIALRTIIAWPAPNAQNTGKAHGSALGDDEVAATKKVLGFDPDADLRGRRRGARARPAGRSSAARPRRPSGSERSTPGRRQAADAHGAASTGCRPAPCPTAGPTRCRRSTADAEGRRHPQGLRRGARRDRAGAARAVGRLGRPRRVQQHHAQGRAVVPARRSTPTKEFPGDPYGRVLHFGIREHAMGSIMNGIALHGGTRVVRRHVPGRSPTTCARRSGWPR